MLRNNLANHTNHKKKQYCIGNIEKILLTFGNDNYRSKFCYYAIKLLIIRNLKL